MKNSLKLLLLSGLCVFVMYAQTWQEITVDDFTLRWATVSGDMLAVEVSATTTGWVAVGFDPTQAMQNANIIIGFVDGSSAYIRDDFGTHPTSHQADTLLGGTHNLTIDGGTESGGVTEIQFTIPLNSGDSYDKPLVIGNTYPILLAKGENGMDDFTSYHAAYATASIEIPSLSLEPYTWGRIKSLD